MDDLTEHALKSTLCVEKFATLNKLREANELCDVTLIAEGKRLRAHRVVLSSESPYFLTMFTSSMLETNLEEITIPDIAFETMEQIVLFLYTSRLRITAENAQNILIAANFLNILSLVELCGDYIVRQMEASNCFSIRELFKTTNCDEKIVARANDFIYKNFKQISLNESFCQLDINSVVELLSDTELCCKSEDDVFHAAIRWLNAISDRKRYAQQIFACIRLPLLSKTFKSEYIDNNPLFNATNTNIIESSLVSRTLKTSLLALNQENQNSLHAYDSSTKKWTKLIDVELKRYTKLAAGSNFVFLAGPDGSNTTYFYDALDLKTMQVTPVPPLPYDFGHTPIFKMIVVGNRLFVFGNRTRVPTNERYITRMLIFDAEQGRWDNEVETLPSTYAPELVAIGKYIYLFQLNKSATKVRKLDTETRTWEDVSMMAHRRIFLLKTTYKGKIYFTDSNDYSARKTLELKMYDPTTNEIKLLAPMKNSAYNLVATSDGIYAYRSHYDEKEQITKRILDFYDVINDEWQCEIELPDRLQAKLFTSIPNLYCPQ